MKKMTILFTSFPDFSGNSKSLFIYLYEQQIQREYGFNMGNRE